MKAKETLLFSLFLSLLLCYRHTKALSLRRMWLCNSSLFFALEFSCHELCCSLFVCYNFFTAIIFPKQRLNMVSLLYRKSNVYLSSTPFCINFLLLSADWGGGVITNCYLASVLSDSKQESNVASQPGFWNLRYKRRFNKAQNKVCSNVVFLSICGLIHSHL